MRTVRGVVGTAMDKEQLNNVCSLSDPCDCNNDQSSEL